MALQYPHMFHPYTNVRPEPLPMSKREYPDWPRGMSSPSDASISRMSLNEAEGLIPLQSEEPVGCFVVDCPSLHVIQRDELPRQLNHNPSVNADVGRSLHLIDILSPVKPTMAFMPSQDLSCWNT